VEAQATKISFLNEELDQMRRSAKNTFDLVLSIATADGIEILEPWAKKITDEAKMPDTLISSVERLRTADIAQHMVVTYLNMIYTGLFKGREKDTRVPPTVLLHYWQKALEWEQVVLDLYGDWYEREEASDGSYTVVEPTVMREVKEVINKYRPKIVEWKKQVGLR
jgi:hypothetical protein